MPIEAETYRLGYSFHLAFACGFIKTALPDEWPIVCRFHQPRTNGIIPNIIRFLHCGFLAPQSMIKKISLPLNGMGSCQPLLPRGNTFLNEERVWEDYNAMQMIRHRKDEFPSPFTSPLPKFY
jgi:hypothetical protein